MWFGGTTNHRASFLTVTVLQRRRESRTSRLDVVSRDKITHSRHQNEMNEVVYCFFSIFVFFLLAQMLHTKTRYRPT